MDEEILLQFKGIKDGRDPERVLWRLRNVSRIENASIDPGRGCLRFWGGDLGRTYPENSTEALGVGFPPFF